MGVTREEVEHVARLARLRLGQGEVASLADDLAGILEHMEALAGVAVDPDDGDGGVPVHDGPAPLRSDGGASPDALLRPPSELAPLWDEGFFLVPRLPGMEAEEEGDGEA